MPKRKKTPVSISPTAAKTVGVIILSLAIGIFLCQRILTYLTTSDYFSIKAIVIDSSLSFIDDRALANLKGKNIFEVDLKQFHRHLATRYPQVSDLRVVRQFPNQIHLQAKARYPFAQIQAGSKVLTLDEKGIVLSSSSLKNQKLPFIVVAQNTYRDFVLGATLAGEDHNVGLDIIKSFKFTHALSTYNIEQIDIESLSKINVSLSNKLYVIFDANKIDEKVKVLGLILAQGKVDPKEAKYVDLRFKEPIVGKK